MKNVLRFKQHLSYYQAASYSRLFNTFPGDDFPNTDSLIQAVIEAQEEAAAQNQQEEQSDNPELSEAATGQPPSSSRLLRSMAPCVIYCYRCTILYGYLKIHN